MTLNVKDVSLFGQNRDTTRIPDLSSGSMATFGWLYWIPEPGGHVSNIIERTVNLLIEQFRVDRPNIVAVVTALATLCQQIEDVLADLTRHRDIGTALGEQLDKIGEIVGLTRTSLDDSEYRSDLYFQVFLNHSGGEPETLIQALQRVVGAERVDYCEPSPAHVILTANKAVRPIPSNLLAKMQKLAAAGVLIDVQYNNTTDNFIFNGDVLENSPDSPYYITINEPYFIGFGFAEYNGIESEGGGAFTELICA